MFKKVKKKKTAGSQAQGWRQSHKEKRWRREKASHVAQDCARQQLWFYLG